MIGPLERFYRSVNSKMRSNRRRRIARFELELKLNREKSQHEVVILEAPSEEALRHTHGRYFKDLPELVKELEARVT